MDDDEPTLPYGYRFLASEEDVKDGDLVWVSGKGWEPATPFNSPKKNIVIRECNKNSFDHGWDV